jgi:hypothetical protein
VKRNLVLMALLVLGTGCTRTSTAEKCLSDAREFISAVNEHQNAHTDSGQFGTALGQVPTSELLDRDKEMISCIVHDPKHRADYQETLDKNDSVTSDRFLRFLLETKQMQDFTRWEQKQQATPTQF